MDTPQFCSSDMSPQSLSPSQIHRAGIQCPVLTQWNESGPHVGPAANRIQITDSYFKYAPKLSFYYARKQNASRVLAIVWASVRLSVCHTRDLYQNGAS